MADGGVEEKPARKKSEARQRGEQVKVRCTADEFNAIAAKAAEAGLSTAAYMRAAALGDAGPRAQRRLPVVDQNVRQVIALHGRYGNNMNQLAYQFNAHGMPEEAAKYQQALIEWGEIRDANLVMIGKNIAPSNGQRPA